MIRLRAMLEAVTMSTIVFSTACGTPHVLGVAGAAVPAKAPASSNVVADPSFESGGFSYWKQCGTVAASITKRASHSGSYSEFGGTLGTPELKGDAAVCQRVTIPPYGRLSFWLNATTTDTLQYAWESASLLGPDGKPVATLYQEAANTAGWQPKSVDVSAYAGREVDLQFDVHGNGYPKDYIGAYVDDVSLASGTPTPSPMPSPTPVAPSKIEHVIIVLQENRTLDNLFHGYPGADTVSSGLTSSGKHVDLRAVHLMTPWDPSHTYHTWLTEYNDGALDGFDKIAIDYGSGAPDDFAYSYAEKSDVRPYWQLAKEGVLADRMFADHRSQSFAGHLFPVAGASGPIDADDPEYYAADNPQGGQSCAGPGTGEAVNLDTGREDKQYHSCFDFQTIADLMDRKGVSWKLYIDAASRTSYVSSFSVVKHIYESSDFTNKVVSPETTIFSDIQGGTLPAVSYVIGTFANSDHAGQKVPSSNGPRWVTSVFNAIGKSAYWKNSVVVLTYDDWGGWYDHVKPHTFNAFEAGFRIPLVIVSPYARRGYVSHRDHYMGSLLHFIEANWNLGSLHTSDARSDALDDCFDFAQTPLRYVPVDAGNPLAVLVDADLDWYGTHPTDPALRD
ncbi:MAG TPA: alkaline phosphatase family protein [Candidatus Baltobacteraceae bacterium]|jgi:phospholipase C